jgi:hypothetical protein
MRESSGLAPLRLSRIQEIEDEDENEDELAAARSSCRTRFETYTFRDCLFSRLQVGCRK